jgi:hypothetical protein
MHDSAAAGAAGMHDTAAMKMDTVSTKADSAVKRDSM